MISVKAYDENNNKKRSFRPFFAVIKPKKSLKKSTRSVFLSKYGIDKTKKSCYNIHINDGAYLRAFLKTGARLYEEQEGKR